MKCCMRSLRPSKAADMLANMVSPPIAGTSLATRIVAFGGSLRNVSSECQTSVRNGGLVSSLRNLISTETFLSRSARTDARSIRRTGGRNPSGSRELMSWLRKMISSFSASAVLDGVAHLVRHRLAQIDAGDLGAEVGADPRDGDAGMLARRWDGLGSCRSACSWAILPGSLRRADRARCLCFRPSWGEYTVAGCGPIRAPAGGVLLRPRHPERTGSAGVLQSRVIRCCESKNTEDAPQAGRKGRRDCRSRPTFRRGSTGCRGAAFTPWSWWRSASPGSSTGSR